MEVEEYRKSDDSYYENRARVFLIQNEISKSIYSNIYTYGQMVLEGRPIQINEILNETLKLSIIYKNIGG